MSAHQDHKADSTVSPSVNPGREEWLVASRQLTLRLLTGWPSIEPLAQIAAGSIRASGADEGFVAVDADTLDADPVDADPTQSASRSARVLSGDVVSSLRKMAPTARLRLPAGMPDPIGSVAGLAMIASLSTGESDYGILVVVRQPGSSMFGPEEAIWFQEFASHAATILDHLNNQRTAAIHTLQHDRARIAANLHDRVIQQLFGMGLRLQSLTSRVQPAEVAADIEGYVDQIDDTIRAVRRSIFALRQPIAESIGLRSRILNVVHQTPFRFEPSVYFDGPIDSAVAGAVNEEVLVALGELLTNVLRHAKATSVHVLVSADLDAQQAILTVSDDGVGWNGVPHSGHGSGNLLERARALGGSCEVSMTDGGGTEVRWWAPFGLPDVTPD